MDKWTYLSRKFMELYLLTCDVCAKFFERSAKKKSGWCVYMKEADGVSSCNKRMVEDYYVRTQSHWGAFVRAQRMEQTISPTLHGRTRTAALSCVRERAHACA